MDEATRQKLHDQLDKLLDAREGVDAAARSSLNALAPFFPEPVDEALAGRVFWAGVALARDALGDVIRRAALKRTYERTSEQRHLLQEWLSMLWPLVHVQSLPALGIGPRPKEFTIFDAMDALSALDAGEIRPAFVANTGKNRRANRWTLARTKLEALAWKKRLVALGYADKAANFEVTKAFGEQWDTIRKWMLQCEQILGAEHVRATLDYAGGPGDLYIQPSIVGMFAAGATPDPLEKLELAGAVYRAELKRSSELSKRKSRAVG